MIVVSLPVLDLCCLLSLIFYAFYCFKRKTDSNSFFSSLLNFRFRRKLILFRLTSHVSVFSFLSFPIWLLSRPVWLSFVCLGPRLCLSVCLSARLCVNPAFVLLLTTCLLVFLLLFAFFHDISPFMICLFACIWIAVYTKLCLTIGRSLVTSNLLMFLLRYSYLTAYLPLGLIIWQCDYNFRFLPQCLSTYISPSMLVSLLLLIVYYDKSHHPVPLLACPSTSVCIYLSHSPSGCPFR